MDQRIFVLTGLLEDANALPASFTNVFDNLEDAKEAMTNWRQNLLDNGDTTVQIAEEAFTDDDRNEVTEFIREWTMEWDSPTFELHYSQVIHEFVKVNGKFQRVSHTL